MARVLIIDDDQAICRVLSRKISQLGHDVRTAQTLRHGLEIQATEDYDVVFLDVRLPDGNGLQALSQINQKNFPPEVIIITGESDPDGAELAIRSGAWDYIQKPSSLKSMVFPLIRALQYRERKASSSLKVLEVPGIIGTSPMMKACLDLLAQAADCDMSVLITGETGTGKELFARSIHNNSSRAKARFVTVDCASLPENLVESELFGSVKGAFTGATATREGMIIQADGGTLFLDEIGELPVSIQKKFLRVLQEHRFRQVGGNREVNSNFRLICATNKNLDSMVKDDTFRQDLLYRLQSMQIELPPLRERKSDIKGLAVHRMFTLCEHYRLPTKGMSPEFVEALESYDWPGNVRELFNTVENVLHATKGETVLFPEHLPMNVRIKAKQAALRKAPSQTSFLDQEPMQEIFPDVDGPYLDESLADTMPAAEIRTDEDPPSPPAPHVQPDQPIQPDPLPRAFAPSALTSERFLTLRELREMTINAMEKTYLEELLQRAGSDLPLALDLSGLSRARFYELLKKHSLSFR